MEMTPQRWEFTSAYLREVFGREDESLARLRERAAAAGLPDISVSPDVGRLLMILASMCARPEGSLALELGTLGGYSAIWIARGLGGRLITLEPEPAHAAFARREIERAGLGDRIELREAAALDALPGLEREFGPGSFDFIFIDAVKTQYPEYLRLCRPLLRVGGLLVADNALGSGWWIGDAPGSSPSRDAVDRFNRRIAADPAFEAACVPARQGVVIAQRIAE